jgi:hypothetical protein
MAVAFLEIPVEVLRALEGSPTEVARELRLAAALHLFERGRLGEAEAAGVAGLDPDLFRRAVACDEVERLQGAS